MSDATYETQVHEPHKVGLPPIVPYFRTLWERREFAMELARTRLRAQHFNTVFGQLWLVINPLLLAGVYFVLVDILRGGDRGAAFLAHLVAGLFAYQIIQQSLQQGVKSVTSGGKLILNTAFPRILLPLSSVLTALMKFLPTMAVYLVVHVATGSPFTVHMLWAPVIVALIALLAAGLSMIVGALQVYFRDLKNFLPYVLRMGLYVSPILYYADEVPSRYDWLLLLNPVAPLLTAWSDTLTRGQAPDAADLLLGLGWGLAFFVVGALFFMSREREFAVRL
jgi:ABC-type polysaccharide/polyol phosphate export permease